MEIEAYKEMARTEINHWFWIGRRAIMRRNIKKCGSPPLDILEIGSGSGGNFEMLQEFGTLTAVELEPLAREISLERHPEQPVMGGALPDELDLPDASFDLICLFDVLEHIEDSRGALKRIFQLLRPGGHVIITVPAYKWMWSDWDDLHHHKRRYTRSLLSEELQSAEFSVQKLSHFNSILFPVIALMRGAIKVLGLKGDTGHGIPSAPLNSVLAGVLRVEGALIDYINLPFGVSVLGIGKKT